MSAIVQNFKEYCTKITLSNIIAAIMNMIVYSVYKAIVIFVFVMILTPFIALALTKLLKKETTV